MPTSDSHTCQLLKVARAMARFALAVLLLLCARALADEGCASDGTCHADEDENAALLQKSAAHKATVTEHMHTNATVGCGPFDLGCECTGKTANADRMAKLRGGALLGDLSFPGPSSLGARKSCSSKAAGR